MTSRRSLLSGRTCQRIGHLLIERRYDQRAERCERCRKQVFSSRWDEGNGRTYRYPLRERWRRHGRTWYGFLRRVFKPKSRSHRELFRPILTEPTFKSLEELAEEEARNNPSTSPRRFVRFV